MDVQQIELRTLSNFDHFCRQSKCVRRMIKKRIAGNFDLVKKNALRKVRKANRDRIADEVDFVPARGQFDAKLGCDYA